MAKQKPIHQVRRPGLRIRVYPNRVEIVKTRGCLLLSKTERIPFRNIATATHAPGTETLIIETNDGKTRPGSFGLWNLGCLVVASLFRHFVGKVYMSKQANLGKVGKLLLLIGIYALIRSSVYIGGQSYHLWRDALIDVLGLSIQLFIWFIWTHQPHA